MSYFLEVLPFALIVTALFELFRHLWLKKRGRARSTLSRELSLGLFACYLAGLFGLVCTPANMWSYLFYFIRHGQSGGELMPLFSGEFNLMPTIFKYITGEYTSDGWVWFMLLGNVAMYLPMGFMLMWTMRRATYLKAIAVGFNISLATELIQPIVGRSFDTDDLILNAVGVVVGAALYLLLRKLFPSVNLLKNESDA